MDHFLSIDQYVTPAVMAAALVFFAWMIFLWVRAGSFYTFWEFCWRRFGDKDGFKNQVLQKFHDDTRDIERFNIIYGFRLGTLGQAKALTQWIGRYKIDVRDAKRARRWLNITESGIAVREVGKKYYTKISALAFISVFLLACGVLLVGQRNALLRMKSSGIWFATNSQTISHVLGGGSVNLNVCADNPSEISKEFSFSKTEVQALCAASGTDSFAVFVEKSVYQQRIIGFTSCVLSYAFLLAGLLSALGHDAASKVRRKLSSDICNES